MKERKFLSIFVCLLMVATVFVVGVPNNSDADDADPQTELTHGSIKIHKA